MPRVRPARAWHDWHDWHGWHHWCLRWPYAGGLGLSRMNNPTLGPGGNVLEFSEPT